MMRLVKAAEMRAMDEAAASYGVSGLLLMENAAKALADAARQMLGANTAKQVVFFCGRGNNGGDGIGAARWLRLYGVGVRLFLLGSKPEDYQGDAAAQLAIYLKSGGKAESIYTAEDIAASEVAVQKAALLIDAVIGIGFSGKLRGLALEVCRLMNASTVPVLAADIPTGVNADDGSADADAVRATQTVTMALPKPGLLLYPGREYAGKIAVASIGTPAPLLHASSAQVGASYLLDAALAAQLLPLRRANIHKGEAGRVLICAGSPGFTGAAALAAQAAVKGGAGLVTLLTPLASRDVLAIKLTEAMVHALSEASEGVLDATAAQAVLERTATTDVLALGPGIGTAASTQAVVREILCKVKVPVVIDADALTALQGYTQILETMAAPKVLTPHPGEMARLTGLSAAVIDRQRLDLAALYAQKWSAVLLLKGAPTVIGLPDGTVYVNTSGASNLATGGSGDVLTGIIASLLAQGVKTSHAALLGAYLHGLAAQQLHGGAAGLAAGDLAAFLPAARTLLEKQSKQAARTDIYNFAVQML